LTANKTRRHRDEKTIRQFSSSCSTKPRNAAAGSLAQRQPGKWKGALGQDSFRAIPGRDTPFLALAGATWLTSGNGNRTLRGVDMSEFFDSLVELIRRTSAEIPDDVQAALLQSLKKEQEGTIAQSALQIVQRNIELARAERFAP
jgi:fumarate hydratase class I